MEGRRFLGEFQGLCPPEDGQQEEAKEGQGTVATTGQAEADGLAGDLVRHPPRIVVSPPLEEVQGREHRERQAPRISAAGHRMIAAHLPGVAREASREGNRPASGSNREEKPSTPVKQAK